MCDPKGSTICGRLVLATAVLAWMPFLARCGSDSQPQPWTTVVPKATCKAGDRVEPGLQGQTSLADRQSGASEQAYNCNLQLVGQYQARAPSGS